MTPLRFEFSHPDDLEAAIAASPVAYVPLGTYEHHGWHLPVGFDGIKAHGLSMRTAERTGGVVFPTFFYGTGGGHVGYKWTVIPEEAQVRPLLALTLDELVRFGFRVIVLLTGHYAGEQVRMVHALAEEAGIRHPHARFLGLTEPEITTPLPGDRSPGDHAAKYETSIALALDPAWARLDRLTPGRDAAQVTTPETPRREGRQWEPADPLYAIWGEDPRASASAEIGERLVSEIVTRLAERVTAALGEASRCEARGP
jgi:creatinine amidohydrolase